MIIAMLAAALVQEASEYEALLKDTKITMAEALAKAMAEAKNGTPIKAILEEDENGVVFSFDIAQGKNTLAINLDAKTGKVVESDLEEGNDQSALRGDLAKAMEDALKQVPGKVVEANLTKDGPVVVVFDGKRAHKLGGKAQESTFTDTFEVDPSEWSSTGRNPYFVLEPGWVLVLQGKEGKTTIDLVITVLDETKKVDGVETRIVEERESEDGEIVEVSRNYFAISKRTNDVYYFGEDVDIYKNGKVVSHDGAWLSGEKGAKYGLMMPGTPLLGAKYYQEIAPEVALDRAEVLGLREKVETPSGTYEKCLKTLETTPLEKGAKDNKYYAPGIGLIVDGACRLVKCGKAKTPK